MPSPFPGMNPYLERAAVWNDFHGGYIHQAQIAITRQVVPGYLVMVEEYLFIHERSGEERLVIGRGDVTVSRTQSPGQVRPAGGVLAAPARGRIPLAVDVEHHRFLEIRDRENRELITVLELLSPSNKANGPDREQYLNKRRQVLTSSAHLIEIDLLRGGPRMPVEDLPECSYYALVSRVENRPDVELWPLGLRDRLPVIPVPLRAPDPDAQLDLQEVLNQLYDGAGYAYRIYGGPPEPRLNAEDAAWAQQFLPAPPT
jgi:hypothetical protein